MMVSLFLATLRALLILGQSIPSILPEQGQEFWIQKIVPKLVSVPEYHYTERSFLNHRNNKKNTSFLALEVEFFYQPQQRTEETRYVDDVLFTYYLLLNTRTQKYPRGILLVGSVMHTAIQARGERRSVMYVAPSTLDRFFSSRVPSEVSQIVHDIGIVVSKAEKVLTFKNWKGRGEWWKNYPQISGWILNKNQTPFAPLLWDDYQQIQTVLPEKSLL